MVPMKMLVCAMTGSGRSSSFSKKPTGAIGQNIKIKSNYIKEYKVNPVMSVIL